MKSLGLAAVFVALAAGAASAGPIERACMRSDREAANRNLCGCIQDVADATLSRRDQALAAKFFKKPAMAQEVRQSDRPSYEVFWKKYKEFGETAQTYCS